MTKLNTFTKRQLEFLALDDNACITKERVYFKGRHVTSMTEIKHMRHISRIKKGGRMIRTLNGLQIGR